MVGDAATELLVGAQSKIETNAKLRSGEHVVTHNNAIKAALHLPAGAGCKKNQKLPAKGEVFLLDIPFYRTRP